MARLDTSHEDHARFLSVMDCDIDQALQDRLADWRYKARLARHSGIHSSHVANDELQRIGGWQ